MKRITKMALASCFAVCCVGMSAFALVGCGSSSKTSIASPTAITCDVESYEYTQLSASTSDEVYSVDSELYALLEKLNGPAEEMNFDYYLTFYDTSDGVTVDSKASGSLSITYEDETIAYESSGVVKDTTKVSSKTVTTAYAYYYDNSAVYFYDKSGNKYYTTSAVLDPTGFRYLILDDIDSYIFWSLARPMSSYAYYWYKYTDDSKTVYKYVYEYTDDDGTDTKNFYIVVENGGMTYVKYTSTLYNSSSITGTMDASEEIILKFTSESNVEVPTDLSSYKEYSL